MANKALKQTRILGVKVNSTQPDKVINFVLSKLKRKEKFFITTPNPEIIVQAQKDKSLKTIINQSTIALPDAIGLKLSDISLKRIPGREMMQKLLKVSSEKGLKVYILGGDEETINKCINKIKADYAVSQVEGKAGPRLNNEGKPVSQKDIKLHKDILNHINSFKPDILFIGFGAPKQEKWAFQNLPKISVGGVMVVGGALDYLAGKNPPPPHLISQMGLEWLWRLLHQPKRAPRIIKATIIFPILLLKEKLRSLLFFWY